MDLTRLQQRKELIDKVASRVAEEGSPLEARIRDENAGNPLYSFLSPYGQPRDANHYYRHKLQLEVFMQDYREQLIARDELTGHYDDFLGYQDVYSRAGAAVSGRPQRRPPAPSPSPSPPQRTEKSPSPAPSFAGDLPARIMEARGEVVSCNRTSGVIRLEGKQQLTCFFVQSSLRGRKETRPGTEVMVNARLVPPASRVNRLPYIATMVWPQADAFAASSVDIIQNLKEPIDPQIMHEYQQSAGEPDKAKIGQQEGQVAELYNPESPVNSEEEEEQQGEDTEVLPPPPQPPALVSRRQGASSSGGPAIQINLKIRDTAGPSQRPSDQYRGPELPEKNMLDEFLRQSSKPEGSTSPTKRRRVDGGDRASELFSAFADLTESRNKRVSQTQVAAGATKMQRPRNEVNVYFEAEILEMNSYHQFSTLGAYVEMDERAAGTDVRFFASISPPAGLTGVWSELTVASRALLGQRLRIEFESSPLKFRHQGRGSVPAVTERQALMNFVTWLRGLRRPVRLFVHAKSGRLLAVLIGKLNRYGLYPDVARTVVGVCDLTSLAWSRGFRGLWAAVGQDRRQPPDFGTLRVAMTPTAGSGGVEAEESDELAELMGQLANQVRETGTETEKRDFLEQAGFQSLDELVEDPAFTTSEISLEPPETSFKPHRINIIRGRDRPASVGTVEISYTGDSGGEVGEAGVQERGGAAAEEEQEDEEEEAHAGLEFYDEALLAVAVCDTAIGPGQKETLTLKLEVYVQEGGVARVERYPDTGCAALLDPPVQVVPIATGRVFVNRQAVQTSNVKVRVRNPGQSLLYIRKGEELGLLEIQKRNFSQRRGEARDQPPEEEVVLVNSATRGKRRNDKLPSF